VPKSDNNNKNHTAHYLVSSFILSKDSHKFKLDIYDNTILRTIADYIDMNKKEQVCFALQSTLAENIRISERRLITHLDKLFSLGLLKKLPKRWKINNYSLGDIISNRLNSEHSSHDAPSCQDFVTCHSVTSSPDAPSPDQVTLRQVTIDNNKKIIKNRLYTSPCVQDLPSADEPSKMRANGNEPEVYLNSDGFLVEKEMSLTSPIVKDIGPTSSRHFLNFTSDNFNKVFDTWLGEKSRNKCAKLWHELDLESQGDEIFTHLSFRVANDYKWLNALAIGKPWFIGKLENWLAAGGWIDPYHKIGDIENAKNSRLGVKLNEQNFTTAQRIAAGYEWARGGDEDNTPF
jgi:hypothetical protein